MSNILSKSKEMSTEYCISIVKLGEVKPIENSDFLGVVMVNGRDIVVRKDAVHEGDMMFYASNECQLNSDFLSVNNEFEIGEYEMNANADKVKKLMDEGKRDEAKQLVGYFDKHARVRMKRLRGVLSMGYLFGLSAMAKWCPLMNDFNMQEHEGEDFDTVNGELFVKAYVPPIPENRHSGQGKGSRLNRHISKFDRMIPGQFAFHYDTQQLNKEIGRIKPTDNLSISVKLHGTSLCIGNILTKKPKWKGLYEKIFCYLPKWLQFTYEDYDVIYSSRTVIKNQYINKKVGEGFYGSDVWGEYYNILKDYITPGMMIYGEIVGYVGGSNSMIQKGYDYKCKPGENKLMIYRISLTDTAGNKHEYNVDEVYNWTVNVLIKSLIRDNKTDIANRIHPIDILYQGTLQNLYPELDIANHWHENVLEMIKKDVAYFGMEQNESLCRNKVAREGIVVRINDDPINEAFKLKCLKFLAKEAEEMDKENVSDMEMIERY